MASRVIRLLAVCLLLHAGWVDAGWVNEARGQAAPTPAAQPAAGQGFNTEQLDALLAPIALYPDALLTQILMASTFPLQVVEAGRWVNDPAHKNLTGDALTKALEAQPWDPSVKSLVPFPSTLAMMNSNLDWLQQVGFAFADQQADVMNSVQRLRRQAHANGSLQTTPQQVVRVEPTEIIIEPAQPNVVYVPAYNPTAVYGTWPYPAYPPVYMPPPPGYVAGTALLSGLAFGAGVAITASLWNWATPAWNRGYVNVNTTRYNNINVNRTAINSNVWQANRPGGRPAGLARPPTGPVGAPARAAGLPAGAIGRQQVSVPRNAVAPPARNTGAGAARSTGAGAARTGAPAAAGQGRGTTARPPGGQAGAGAGQRNLSTPQRAPQQSRQQFSSQSQARSQNAFSGLNEGRQASQFGARGAQSRSTAGQSRGVRAGGGARPGGRR
ncbi:MAG TPA: DUF3300 domain-containing protein [Rhodopila sp.]|nr:DUF3300 domain-containing protein [Rhodopila sp.]